MRRRTETLMHHDHMNFEVPLPKSTGNLNLFQVLGLTGSCMEEAQLNVANFSL